jgi:hypothetical protein
VTPDPAIFLSTIILASAALVAIVGGLLVARFVGLDSDQQTTRRVLLDADGRLRAASRRAAEARANLQRWDAWDFLMDRDVLNEIAGGVTDPAELNRLADCRLTEQELQPYLESVVEEFSTARGVLADRVSESGGTWEDFRKETPDLPETSWLPVWAKVFEEVSGYRAVEERARQEAVRRRYGFLGFDPIRPPLTMPVPPDLAGRAAIASYERQRRDDLAASYQRAQQRVDDYRDELDRLSQAHAEIIRPDKRLWFGVIVLATYAAVGVAWPLFVLSQGPTDLAQVRHFVWLFMGALLILIIYVVAYLVSITRRKLPPVVGSPDDGNRGEPDAKPGNDMFMTAVVLGLAVLLAAVLLLAWLNP